MERRRIIIAVAVSATVGLIASEASAATITVCPSGCDFSTIQAGVNGAAAGDTVSIGAATYAENVVVDRSITLQGAGAGATIVVPAVSGPNPCNGSSLCAGSSSIILVQADNVTISGMTLDGDNPGLQSGVSIGGADIDARNGIITNHTLGVFDGLTVSGVTVQNIFLRGIYASTGGTFTFTNNTVTNVRGDASSIAIFNFAGAGTISGNTVSQANDAIAANFSLGTTITGNTITNAGSGVHTDNAAGNGGMADVIDGNTVQSCDASGYGVWAFAPALGPQFTNNKVTSCAVGMAAFGRAASGVGSTLFQGNTVDGGAAPAGSVGALASTDEFMYGTGNVDVQFVSNRISRCETGLVVDETKGGAATAAANYNVISGNTTGASGAAAATVDATNNFWGCNGGPGSAGCDAVTGSFNANPWIIDQLSINPSPVNPGDTATLMVDLTWNSDGLQPGGGPVPDGTPIAYASNPAGTAFTPASGATSAGTASTTFPASAGVQACARIPADVATANLECILPNLNGPVPSEACTPAPYPLALGSMVVVGGTTIGATDDFKSFCGDTTAATSAPDVVYAFTVPQTGTLKVDVNAVSAGFNPAVYLQQTCGTDYYCSDFGATSESIYGEFPAGTYYVVVDGADGSSGDFQLTLSLAIPTCGDGVVNTGEQCDTGPGSTPGDGCGDAGAANQCQYEAPVMGSDQCPGEPISVGAGTTIVPVSGVATTNGYTNDYSSLCAPYSTLGPDHVYAVTPSASGTLTVSVGYASDGTTDICAQNVNNPGCWDRVLYARTNCTDAMTEVACSDKGAFDVETIAFAATAGTTYYIIVDGYDDQYYSQGPFNLRFILQ